MHKQVHNHLTTHKLLLGGQFRFRKYHSTCSCILKLLDDVYCNMEPRKVTGVVFLDLKKAFDTVAHTILLKKLSIHWFKNYLTGRRQAVKYQGMLSPFLPISCGVPQGSILIGADVIHYVH